VEGRIRPPCSHRLDLGLGVTGRVEKNTWPELEKMAPQMGTKIDSPDVETMVLTD